MSVNQSSGTQLSETARQLDLTVGLSVQETSLIAALVALVVPFLIHFLQWTAQVRKDRRWARQIAQCLVPDLVTTILEIETIQRSLENHRDENSEVHLPLETARSLTLTLSPRLRSESDWIYRIDPTALGHISVGAAVTESFNTTIIGSHIGVSEYADRENTRLSAKDDLLSVGALMMVPRSMYIEERQIQQLSMVRRHFEQALSILNRKYKIESIEPAA